MTPNTSNETNNSDSSILRFNFEIKVPEILLAML